ncbi:MAG: coproporphyrinogen III oxidase, partial [Deltaproteobacteria bacterium]|nr:coproporphyrinogen III oxidase [Deltaproteobacteria bacterium]
MLTSSEVITFLQETRVRFDAFCRKFNPGSEIEVQDFDSPLGPLQVATSCGEVFEKASCTYCDLEIDTPPVLFEQMETKVPKMQALCLEVNIFPANPKVPKSYMELRANSAGKVILAGGTDIFPYFPDQNDHDLVAGRIRSLCEQHGLDYRALQKTRADFFQSKYRPGPVGSHAGIYSFSQPESDFAFFKEMGVVYFEIYEELVARHGSEPFGSEDKAHQHKLHGQWAQWVMVEDEGTLFGLRKGIPIDS